MFKSVLPTDDSYNDLREVVDSAVKGDRSLFNYNELTEYYNGQPVDAIIGFPYPEKNHKVLQDQLSKRGLERGLDYTLSFLDVTEEDEGEEKEQRDIEAQIVKLTEKNGTLIQKTSKRKRAVAPAVSAAPEGEIVAPAPAGAPEGLNATAAAASAAKAAPAKTTAPAKAAPPRRR